MAGFKRPLTYLDYNASAPLRASARLKMLECIDVTSNPSSIHASGRLGRKYIEEARRQLGEILDVSANQIIFTSGATEANNTILKGFSGQRILVAATEHLSVLQSGVALEPIPVDENGIINLAALEKLLRAEPTALVSVMLANNETGVIQPIVEIAQLAHAQGALLHTDCVQAVGRLPFTREALDADFITVSAHKIGGALGAGAIIFKAGLTVPKLIEGGGQERRQRAGTENFIAIAAFGTAIVEAASNIPEFQKLEKFQSKIEAHLKNSGAEIFGKNAPRLPNTISFAKKGLDSQTLLMRFDLEGICLSSGSACSSGTVQESHVLKAMNIDPALSRSALRLSMGHLTRIEDIDLFLKIWDKIAA